MQFSQALVALVATASFCSAAPSFLKRQNSCQSSYGCPFEIMVAGCSASQITDGQIRVTNSSISQLTDGQARCDLTGSAPTNFTLSNGQVTDSSGRLCEISKQNQFQCSATPDAGASTTGFSVCNGLLSYNSNSSFIACLATGEYPGYNIYTASVDRSTVTNCMAVELDVPSCPVTSTCIPETKTATATVVSTQIPAAVTVTQTQIPAAVTVTTTQVPAAVTVNQTITATTAVTVVQTTTKVPAAVTVNQTMTATTAVTVVQTSTQAPVTITKTAAPVTVTATQPAQTVVQTQVNTVTSVQTVVQTQTVVTTATPATTLIAKTSSSSAAQATCTNINRSLGSANFPTTIDVVNKNTGASGSSYLAYIGGGNSTIFTFNAQSSSGQCSLNFYFPTNAQIQAVGGTTASQISSSSIAVTLYELVSVSSVTDTYATKPARGQSFDLTLTPGQNSTITTFACPSSSSSYELTASDSNTLSFFEDYNLPILGLAIASCQ